ncbi:MAG: hypothetical protein QOK05_2038 [Chloroflexota bacterium]|jgi:alkylhydroperoxidase family enzyme|nr:hypothetical protein [Chloroflexota bacterium]
MEERGLQVPNLYRTIAHSPTMLKAWMGFTWPLRYDAVSPRRIRELVIMRVAQLTGAIYEWSHHWPMALANGISEDQLNNLSTWTSATTFDAEERAALRYADAITEMRVTDEVFGDVRAVFSPEMIIEITLTASFYTNLARVTQALGIDLEPGFEAYADKIRPQG